MAKRLAAPLLNYILTRLLTKRFIYIRPVTYGTNCIHIHTIRETSNWLNKQYDNDVVGRKHAYRPYIIYDMYLWSEVRKGLPSVTASINFSVYGGQNIFPTSRTFESVILSINGNQGGYNIPNVSVRASHNECQFTMQSLCLYTFDFLFYK